MKSLVGMTSGYAKTCVIYQGRRPGSSLPLALLALPFSVPIPDLVGSLPLSGPGNPSNELICLSLLLLHIF